MKTSIHYYYLSLGVRGTENNLPGDSGGSGSDQRRSASSLATILLLDSTFHQEGCRLKRVPRRGLDPLCNFNVARKNTKAVTEQLWGLFEVAHWWHRGTVPVTSSTATDPRSKPVLAA